MQELGHYSYYIFWHPGDSCYFAVSPEFKNLSAFGDTPEEALKELKIALGVSIELYMEEGWPLPKPAPPELKTFKAGIEKTVINEVPPIDFDDAPGVPSGAVPSVAGAGAIFDDDAE